MHPIFKIAMLGLVPAIAALAAGIMFQHLSHGGRTKPNPGIDALGFTLGYSRGL